MASASIGDPQSLNLFAYTRNNPVNFVDPSGLEWVCNRTQIGYIADTNPVVPLILVECRNVGKTKAGNGKGGGSGKGSSGRGGKVHQQSRQKSCKYQNFDVNLRVEGLSQSEVSDVLRTAVGEASNYYAKDEVENIIAIMENMLSVNYAQKRLPKNRNYDLKTFGKPVSGSTKISGILGEFDAYRKKPAGENKLNEAKRANGGILSANNYVCTQLTEGIEYLSSPNVGFKGGLMTSYGVTANRGKGAYKKRVSDLTYLFQIGDTKFFRYRETIVKRP